MVKSPTTFRHLPQPPTSSNQPPSENSVSTTLIRQSSNPSQTPASESPSELPTATFRFWPQIPTQQLNGLTQMFYHITLLATSLSSPSVTKLWPPAIMLSYQTFFRRYKMSKMPLTQLHSVAKSKFPPFILWLCWLSRILHLPGRLTRIWKTQWSRCWSFWRIIKLRLLLTRTRFSLTRVTRDLKHLRSVCFSQIRVGLIRVTVNFTRTCSMLRLVGNFFFFLSFMLKCWLSSQRQE